MWNVQLKPTKELEGTPSTARQELESISTPQLGAFGGTQMNLSTNQAVMQLVVVWLKAIVHQPCRLHLEQAHWDQRPT